MNRSIKALKAAQNPHKIRSFCSCCVVNEPELVDPLQTQAPLIFIPGHGISVAGNVVLELTVLVENFVFILRLFFLLSLLIALVYTIVPADPVRDSFEQRVESGVFAFGALCGLLILQIF